MNTFGKLLVGAIGNNTSILIVGKKVRDWDSIKNLIKNDVFSYHLITRTNNVPPKAIEFSMGNKLRFEIWDEQLEIRLCGCSFDYVFTNVPEVAQNEQVLACCCMNSGVIVVGRIG